MDDAAAAARPVLGPEPPPAPPPPEAPAAPPPSVKPVGSALVWGEGDEVDPDSADMAALLALQEECTPEERAEAFKVRAYARAPGAGCGLRGR